MAKSTNYYDTFIEVADDCPATHGETPPTKAPRTAARIQYEMLRNNPYRYTSDDVVYASNGERRGIGREEFFSRNQACLRSSPLTKRYGWGIHLDSEGRVAIYAVDTTEYRRHAEDDELNHLKAMRSRRAG